MLSESKIYCKIIFKDGLFNNLSSLSGEIYKDELEKSTNDWIPIKNIDCANFNIKLETALINKQDIQKIINLKDGQPINF